MVTEMKIQDILWPKDRICTDREMYFHFNEKEIIVKEEQICILFQKGGIVTTDTYFNGLTIEKWRKYTKVSKVLLTLSLQGRFNVSLCWQQKINDMYIERELKMITVNTDIQTEITLEYPEETKGIFSFRLEAIEKGGKFFGGYYATKIPQNEIHPVKLGIVICTYKREKYVCDNVMQINQDIIGNPENPLYEKMEIFISDNGQTLDQYELESEKVHIFRNKNTGGAGGFTRGLIEILKRQDKGITHVLLMDDDVIVDTASILRTAAILALLKEEYASAFVGGAMLRSDQRNIQVESGASWNAGNLIPLKTNLDLSLAQSCLMNEQEEYVEYNAWWYCCFPMEHVRPDNLPLPVFIRGDDLEYGLRNMKTLILMNGICVWHEPFENKYSSFLEYYIIRNRLINNSFHFPNWGRKELIRELVREYRREGYLYRYKNIALYMQGIRDFLKGIDFLEQTDGEQLHKQIMDSGYQAVEAKQLEVPFFYQEYERGLKEQHSLLHELVRRITINGYLLPAKHARTVPMATARPEFVWRARTILFYDIVENKGFVTHRSLRTFMKQGFEMLGVIAAILTKYEKAKQSYIRRGGEIRQLSFWERYLGIEGEDESD